MTSDDVSGRRVAPSGGPLAVFQAISLATISVMPAFLVGALAVSLRSELNFGRGALGLAVAWFFAATATSASLFGRDVERRGVRRSLGLGAAGSTVALLAIAGSQSYVWLLVALTVGGMANALTQPAVNAALSQGVAIGRLGTAMGIKQSSVPAATLLGGLAVPTLAATFGWRWAFVAAACIGCLGGLSVTRFGRHSRTVAEGRRPRPTLKEGVSDLPALVTLTVAAALAAGAATSLGAFFVDGAVSAGLAEGQAGLLFAASSLLSLLIRVLLGWLADRYATRSTLGVIVWLLAIGAPGYLFLATGVESLYVLGGFLAYGAGWGWPGLFHYTVISQHPTTPAAATGIIQTGLALGAGLGPLVLGAVAQQFAYDVAWMSAGAASLVGACLFWAGRAQLRRALSKSIAPVTTALPDSLLRGGGRGREVGSGVFAERVETIGADVTVLSIAPGASWRARSFVADAEIVLLEGAHVALQLGMVKRAAVVGHGYSIPAGLVWQANNGGGVEARIAVVSGRHS